MKKIIIFTSDLYQGGVAESTRKLAKLLSKETEVVICSYDALPINKDIPKGIKVIKLNCPLSSGFRETKLAMRVSSVLRYFCLPIAVIKFLYVIFKVKPDVVYSMTYIPNLVNVFCSHLFKYKVILSERQDPREDIPNKSLISRALKHFYPQADLIHANSIEMVDAIEEYYGIERSKIYHFDNFFFRDEIEYQSKEVVEKELFRSKFNLITSGRLSKQKGQWHLLDILKSLREKGIDASLIILGDGDMKEELITLSKLYRLSKYVHFLGDVSNPHKYVGNSDLFIFPSIWESFGNTLVEAMALKIPVASTVCRSGPGQIIDYGKFGFNMGVFPAYGSGKIEAGDLNTICNELKLILEEKRLAYIKKSDAGYDRFDSSNIAAKVINVFLK